MPTAVITESSENTTSSSRICTITPAKETVTPAGGRLAVGALQFLMHLDHAFPDQEESAHEQNQIAPRHDRG
jgi:hypothetical protein